MLLELDGLRLLELDGLREPGDVGKIERPVG
jgi:hypothetical protein